MQHNALLGVLALTLACARLVAAAARRRRARAYAIWIYLYIPQWGVLREGTATHIRLVSTHDARSVLLKPLNQALQRRCTQLTEIRNRILDDSTL